MFGLGPVPAVSEVLARAGWKIGDIERVEINEAFAAIALALIQELGLLRGDRECRRRRGGSWAPAWRHRRGPNNAADACDASRGYSARSRHDVHWGWPGHCACVGKRLTKRKSFFRSLHRNSNDRLATHRRLRIRKRINGQASNPDRGFHASGAPDRILSNLIGSRSGRQIRGTEWVAEMAAGLAQ